MPASSDSPSTSPEARAAYAAALTLVPRLADHARIPGTQPPTAALAEAEALLAQALGSDPAFALAAAACGNAALRRADFAFARRWYALAVHFDPDFAAAWLALGELQHAAGDDAADASFARALALQRVYPAAAPDPAACRVLVLAVDGPWTRSVPLDALVDSRALALHRWYVGADIPPLPPHDVVFNALPADDAAVPAVARAAAFVAASPRRAINAPERLVGVARHRLAATLAAVPRCVVPPTRRMTAVALRAAAPDGPLVVRPLDAHGGRGTQLVAEAHAFAAPLDGDDVYDVTPFVDYRSADGRYRKLRIVFVDGVPYPYHLAAGDDWMLHYQRSATPHEPALQREERAFLDDPAATVPGWDALGALAAATGLDYVGIDAAVLPDGRLLVFEADPAMFVQRTPAGERIADALQQLVRRRAGR